MKRWSAMIAAALLVLSCFSGCGGAASSAAETSETASSVSEAVPAESDVAEVQSEESAAGTSETASSVQESAEAEAEEAEAEEPAVVIEYPIEGDITLRIWKPFEGMMFGELMSSFEDMPMLGNIEAATGISLEFDSVSEMGSSEAFNLMIASGDWDDLINISGYTGGLSKAYEDSLCINLDPYLDEHMPDFKQALEELKEKFPNGYKQTRTDEGDLLAVYSINDEYVQEQGLLFRKDWAEEIGMEDIVTIDDLEQYLEYAVSTYSPQYPLTPSSGGIIDGITGAFKTCGFDASGYSVDLGLYLEDGQVVPSLTSDNTRRYMEWFHSMYEMGAIKPDFFNESYGPDWANAYFADNDVAITFLRSDKISTIENTSEVPGFELQPTVSIVENEGDEFTFGDEHSVVMANFSIMSTTEYPEACMEFLNWFYTPDGYILSNYGEEGLSFEYNEDGTVAFTDLIVNSSYSNKVQVKNVYGAMIFGFVKDVDSFFYTYAPVEQKAMEIWSQVSDSSRMPTFQLTGDNATEASAIASDIVAYAATQVTKWLTGEEALTDEGWNTYVETCYSMGLQDAVDIYQAGYESFMAR